MVYQKVDEMENQIHVVFQSISDNAKSEGASLEENMRNIAQNLQQYKDQIKELEECAIPTTPPYIRAQRK